MQILEVGKPFPFKNPAGHGDYVTSAVIGQSFDVICWAAGVNAKEVHAWRRGTLRYGAFIRDDIPFFLLYFPDLKWPLDVSINILAVKEGGRPYQDYLGGVGNAVNLYLVDAGTNILKGMRLIGLDNTVAGSIRLACVNQLDKYSSSTELNTHLEAIVSKIQTLEMVRATNMVELSSK